MREKVIVLCCQHGGLAAARSLSRHGLYVIGITNDKSEFGLKSTCFNETAISPDPKDTYAFRDFLLDQKDNWGGSLLLESSDRYMTAISKHKDVLAKHYRMISPDTEIVDTFVKKDKTYALADQAEVPHPNIYKLETLQELDNLQDKIQFPIMIKPVVSHLFVQIFKKKLLICETFDELRNNFRRTLEAKQAVILSEIIPGTDYRTMEKVQLYINTKGEISAEFFSIKLRQSPPTYGAMRVGKSTPVNQEVLELSRRLLKKINFRGYASVEFKRDFRDNQLKLMEVNIRQPLSGGLAIRSGVDFPWIIYQDVMLDRQVRIDHYHVNTYFIDGIDDIINFIFNDPSKNLINFLMPYFGRKTFGILDWKDLNPFSKMLSNRSKYYMGKITGSNKTS